MSDQQPIEWSSIKVRLGDLQPWPRNPRQINRDEARRLLESVEEFGQVLTFIVGPNLEVYDGHQRQLVWAASDKYGPDSEWDARQSSRPLTEKEREKLTIYIHKGATGAFDFDKLANEFDLDELIDWGFSPWELGGIDPEAEDDEFDAHEHWKGMPEFNQEDRRPVKQVIVNFESLADIEEFAELMQQTVTENTRSIWFPAKANMSLVNIRYVDADES